MKKKKTPKKNYAFVDNANVTVSVARQGRHIDRGKLKGWLERRWNVEKVFMLMGYHPDYESMYDYFRSLGYELVFKPMNIGENIELKGNIDTDLVLRVMKERRNYDKAILLTGDGDFLSLVNHLKDKKKLGQIIVPHSGRYSHFLEEAAGEFITSLTGKKRWLAYKKGEKNKNASKKEAGEKNPKDSNTKEEGTSKQKREPIQDAVNLKKQQTKKKSNRKRKGSQSTVQEKKDRTPNQTKKSTSKQEDTRNKKSSTEAPSKASPISFPKKTETQPPKVSPQTPASKSVQATVRKKKTMHRKKTPKKTTVDPSHHTRFFD